MTEEPAPQAGFKTSTMQTMLTAHSVKTFSQYQEMVFPPEREEYALKELYRGDKERIKRELLNMYSNHLLNKSKDMITQLTTNYEEKKFLTKSTFMSNSKFQ